MIELLTAKYRACAHMHTVSMTAHMCAHLPTCVHIWTRTIWRIVSTSTYRSPTDGGHSPEAFGDTFTHRSASSNSTRPSPLIFTRHLGELEFTRSNMTGYRLPFKYRYVESRTPLGHSNPKGRTNSSSITRIVPHPETTPRTPAPRSVQ